MSSVWKRWAALFEEEEGPAVAHYDPVHLAAVITACMVVAGALFWLLWTLFVYEGGLFVKLRLLLAHRDNDHRATFEGWQANAAALAICAGVVYLLQKADRRAVKRAK
jgi:hypothetical protein